MRALRTLIAAGLLALATQGTASAGDNWWKYSDESFKKLQAEDKPILVEINADWCPICAKQRPIIDRLTSTDSLKNMNILVVNFDGQKGVVRAFGATEQSTLIVFHGTKETGRSVGETDTMAIKQLLESASKG
jgi:thioredoxin 1